MRQLASEAPQYIDQWFAGSLASSTDPRVGKRRRRNRWKRLLGQSHWCGWQAFAMVRAWWRLLQRLHDLARTASIRPGGAIPKESAYLCVRGELLWTLAAMFPEIQPCRALAPLAAEVLSATVADTLDGEGLPHARQLPVFHRLFASWTRCRLLSAALESKPDRATLGACWDNDAEQQYFLAVREAVRLLRSDGHACFVQSERRDGAIGSERKCRESDRPGRRPCTERRQALSACDRPVGGEP